MSSRPTKPELSLDEKLNLFREKLREKLSKESNFGAAIAATICTQLEVFLQGEMLLASLLDPLLYGHTRTDKAQSIMKEVTREVFGLSIHFLMTTHSGFATQKKKLKKQIDSTQTQKSIEVMQQENLFDSQDSSEMPLQSDTSKQKYQKEKNSGLPNFNNTKNISDLLGNIENLSQTPAPKQSSVSLVKTEQSHHDPKARQLNPEYTFNTFVTGLGNELARKLCYDAAQKPGECANPVLIYGSTGLGKTHLLHAVGNEIRKQRPKYKILYVTSEDFYDGFSKIFRSKNKSGRVDSSKEEFKQKYRDVDVLLMDDIQLLEGKDATQIEFFHTFNDLFQAQKQIVLTSDKYPRDIPRMEERLKSRFVQGLLASVEPPSFEDRVAIIQVKCKTFGLKLTEKQMELIANHVKDSVRDIEGVLNTLRAKRALDGNLPTDEAVRNEIRKHVKSAPSGLDVAAIQRAVANHFGIRLQEMLGDCRKGTLVLPRQLAMYLTRQMLDLTNMEIASEFGRKDHTTVMHAIKKIQGLMGDDASTLETIRELKRKLEQGQH